METGTGVIVAAFVDIGLQLNSPIAKAALTHRASVSLSKRLNFIIQMHLIKYN